MKFEKIKLLYWSFWPILLLFVLGGYYFVPKVVDQSHLEVIPESVDAVILINPVSLYGAYEKLLEENPAALKDLAPLDDSEDSFNPNLGINPLLKVAVSHYQPSENEQGFVLVVGLTNFSDFVSTVNGRDNIPAPEKINDGEFVVMEKDDQIFLRKGLIGLLYQAQAGMVSKDLAEKIFVEFFEHENSLMNAQPSFKEAVNSDSQFTFWSENSSNLAANLPPQVAMINDLFDHKIVDINIAKEGLNTDAMLELVEEGAIIERDVNDVELIGDECFRFAASVNPKEFSSFFDLVLSEDKKYLISSWNGGICASVEGFKNVEIKKVNVQPSQDPLYPFKYDTVGVLSSGISNMLSSIEGQITYPFFTVACEMSDTEGVRQLIEDDSTISQVGDYYSYILPNYFIKKEVSGGTFGTEIILEPQRIYFYFVDQSIVFSPELPEVDFQPMYSTFYVEFSFPKFFDTYQPKSLYSLDGIVMSMFEDFKFDTYKVQFKESKDGMIYLEGNFNLLNTSNHFIGFPMLMSELSSIASLPLL